MCSSDAAAVFGRSVGILYLLSYELILDLRCRSHAEVTVHEVIPPRGWEGPCCRHNMPVLACEPGRAVVGCGGRGRRGKAMFRKFPSQKPMCHRGTHSQCHGNVIK